MGVDGRYARRYGHAVGRRAGSRFCPGPRRAGAEEGIGPFTRLVIRGVTVIDGTGGPPFGPMDIVIEGNRIADILPAGTPGLPLKDKRPPRDAVREIDATGMYVLPGFVDTHAHGAGIAKADNRLTPISFGWRMASPPSAGVPLADYVTTDSEKRRSAANAIVAPRIFNYQTLGAGWSKGRVDTPEKARQWVEWAAQNNVDGG